MASAASLRVAVTGFASCPYYQRAKTALLGIQALNSALGVEVVEHPTRDAFREFWFKLRDTMGPRAAAHSSSPAVWLNGTDFLGGCDATLAWIRSNYMAGGSTFQPPRVIHDNDRIVEGEPKYDYDLIVIGGGSGGLACSKEARALGAKVAVLDYVKPSWAGTTWGLGGTCVNVGCIPKKLMHQAALLGDSMQDAIHYGWKLPTVIETPASATSASSASSGSAGAGAHGGMSMSDDDDMAMPVARVTVDHDWNKMVESVQAHIASLNFGYRVQLRDKKIDYKNMLGAFVDPHTIECTDRAGRKVRLSARRFVVAVGGRPRPLDCPGHEHTISSDDLFSMTHAPGKTLVIGASYVALECAGFLAGLHYDVSVMVRSILLRGFDQEMAERIGEHMAGHGVKFIRPATPTKIEKLPSGKLLVTYENADTHEVSTAEYDSIFVATGRIADTTGLNLSAAGVAVNSDGKIKCVNEQTTTPHVYAIGDVVAGYPELTPVAIMGGKLLARRLYGESTEGMDFTRIPTTVFTPLEYGACGLSEEAAKEKFGAANIEVYISAFKPLEWVVAPNRTSEAYAKLIVHKEDANRIVGLHILGPNAGEITQGWGATLRLGATFESFCNTVGIHPTVAEEFTTMNITKSSGASAAKTGC